MKIELRPQYRIPYHNLMPNLKATRQRALFRGGWHGIATVRCQPESKLPNPRGLWKYPRRIEVSSSVQLNSLFPLHRPITGAEICLKTPTHNQIGHHFPVPEVFCIGELILPGPFTQTLTIIKHHRNICAHSSV